MIFIVTVCGFTIQCHIASCGFVGLGRAVVHCMSCHSRYSKERKTGARQALKTSIEKATPWHVEAGEIK